MERYPAFLEYDANIRMYGVVFADLDGTVAMGATVDEAMRNAEEALRDTIEITRERGWDVPPPRPLSEVELPEEFEVVGILLIEAPA